MPYTERSKPQVVLNKMTKAVYDSIEKDPDQLYAVTDADIYDLPVASADTLGGVKVGENLTIDEDGTLNAQAGGGDTVYDDNGVSIIDTTGTRVKIGNGAASYNQGVAIGVSAQAGTGSLERRSVAIGNEAKATAANAIAIGPSSIAANSQSISIGNRADSQAVGAVAIGQSAYAYGKNSVALGINSYAEDMDTVSVGDPGYEPDGTPAYYRKIVCVEDGTDAHDAATVGQMPKERELTQAEYDALTDEEKNNGTTYYITDASNRQNDVYSTAEQPIGTWIDGKTIYRKTIDLGAMPNADSKSVAHGVSNINTVVKIEGVMFQGANAWAIPYTGVSILSVEGSNVMIRTTSDYRSFNAYVTIYYTKN